jgi:hypothetical protein
MCGRYYSLFDKQQVAEHFHVRSAEDNVRLQCGRTRARCPSASSPARALSGLAAATDDWLEGIGRDVDEDKHENSKNNYPSHRARGSGHASQTLVKYDLGPRSRSRLADFFSLGPH